MNFKTGHDETDRVSRSVCDALLRGVWWWEFIAPENYFIHFDPITVGGGGRSVCQM